jgi:hypothetical protein
MGAACLGPATSFGWSVNTTSPGTIDTNSAGDTLLFPIYTTANAGTGTAAATPAPASTSFSVTNTSLSETVAAKIRFREQVHSMDVLDFIVVLSPKDKFDFYVDQKDGAARPTMHWCDNSCVVGPSTTPNAQGCFDQPFPTGSSFVESDAQMSVGHLEVLGMAELSNVCVNSSGSAVDCGTGGAQNLAAAAKHGSDGKPANCPILVTALQNYQNVSSINAASSLGNVNNVLIGRYVIDNGVQLADGFHIGIEGGSDAIGIKNSNVTGTAPNIKITSQSSTPCTQSGNCPSSSGYYAWDKLDWDHPHLGEMPGLQYFQSALTATNVGGDWSNNPANDVGVDWVLSFPDKYAYLDYSTDCSSSKTWCLLPTTKTTYGLRNVWTGSPTQDLCLGTSNLAIYDTEEQSASQSVSVSPGAFTEFQVCNELNVFTVAASDEQPKPSVIQINVTDPTNPLSAITRQIVTYENLTAIGGWGLLDLPWNSIGDAVTGLIFTTRATSGPADQNGSLTDLQKDVGDNYAKDQ